MNKAILVIDMPNSCKECSLFGSNYADMCCKGMNNRGIDYPFPEDFRQDWCPLKEAPKKDEEYHLLEWGAGYKMGWNDCVNYVTSD